MKLLEDRVFVRAEEAFVEAGAWMRVNVSSHGRGKGVLGSRRAVEAGCCRVEATVQQAPPPASLWKFDFLSRQPLSRLTLIYNSSVSCSPPILLLAPSNPPRYLQLIPALLARSVAHIDEFLRCEQAAQADKLVQREHELRASLENDIKTAKVGPPSLVLVLRLPRL
eukprot:6181273-Pleurochrysis_carterae.AAC.2